MKGHLLTVLYGRACQKTQGRQQERCRDNAGEEDLNGYINKARPSILEQAGDKVCGFLFIFKL